MYRQRVLLRVAGLFAAMAAVGLSKDKCECSDLPGLRDYLAEKETAIQVWQEILDDNKVILTETGAANKFKDKMKKRFPKKDFSVVGEEESDGKIKYDPKYRERVCPIQWDSTQRHEQLHAVWDETHYDTAYDRDKWLGKLVTGQGGKDYARKEIFSLSHQVGFLKAKIDELAKSCRWKCKCTQQRYDSMLACANSCPRPSLRCIAPTCLEIDPDTGKWNGRLIGALLPGALECSAEAGPLK